MKAFLIKKLIEYKMLPNKYKCTGKHNNFNIAKDSSELDGF